MIDTCIFDYRDFEYWYGDLNTEIDVTKQKLFKWDGGNFIQIEKPFLYVSDKPINKDKYLFIKLCPMLVGNYDIGICEILRCIEQNLKFSLKPVVCEAVMRTDTQADCSAEDLFFEDQDEEWDTCVQDVQCRKAKKTESKCNTISKITNIFNTIKFDEKNGKAKFKNKKLDLEFTIIVNNRGGVHMYSECQYWDFYKIKENDKDVIGIMGYWVENKDQFNKNYYLSELLSD